VNSRSNEIMAHEFIQALTERFGEAVIETHSFRGDEVAVISRDFWRPASSFLKEECGFTMMLDLCAVDYPERAQRFEVVCHLYRLEDGKRIRLKTRCPPDDPLVPSLTSIFLAANWFEREAFDLFGIRFGGHPNLKRILCHHQFEGHPLRKDFPKDRRGVIPASETLLDEMGHEVD
jgi:NADH-quinone oxidoreductase subunit C